MIIGIDASRANLKHKTGTEWYSFYVIKYLARLDKENKYILYLNKPASDELKEIIKDNPNFSCQVLSWPISFFWTLGRLSLEMLIKKPDVLFVPAHTLPLILPKKTIITIHDVAFARERNLYRFEKVKVEKRINKGIISLLAKLITKGRYKANSIDYLQWSTIYALRKATKIITVSQFTKNELLDIYPEAQEEKIKVVHNGYNNKLYHRIYDQEKIDRVLQEYGLEKPYLLYVGRLEKKKNTSTLIEAFSILKENNPEIKEKLLLIGNAGYGYDEARYVVEEFNLHHEVFMPGWIKEKNLPYIYNGATAFVFPSRHEGFGIPIIQSLACGIPVVASNLIVFKEIAKDAILYFNKDDKHNMAQALREIVVNKELREELRKKGLKAAKEYSWEKCAQETLEVIKNI